MVCRFESCRVLQFPNPLKRTEIESYILIHMETTRKTLSTQEEFFDAYPEHKKLHDSKAKFGDGFADHVHWLLDKLHREHGIVLCNRASAEELLSVSHELFGSEKRAEEYVGTLFTSSEVQPCMNALQKLIYEYIGVDYDKFMAEKEDMLEQMRMAEECTSD
jgi:hypothetical protein